MKNKGTEVEVETSSDGIKIIAKGKGAVFGVILLLFLTISPWVPEARYYSTLLMFGFLFVFTFSMQRWIR